MRCTADAAGTDAVGTADFGDGRLRRFAKFDKMKFIGAACRFES